MSSQNLRDALTGRIISMDEVDGAFGTSCLQNVKSTRTDIDDISGLIADAVALSAKVQTLVGAIIGCGKGEARGTEAKPTPSGVLSQLGDRARYACNEVASAEEELERLARSFGL